MRSKKPIIFICPECKKTVSIEKPKRRRAVLVI